MLALKTGEIIMAMTQEKLLRHFDQFIENEYCGMVDYELSNFPSVDRDKILSDMNQKIDQLKKFRNQLEEMLNEKQTPK